MNRSYICQALATALVIATTIGGAHADPGSSGNPPKSTTTEESTHGLHGNVPSPTPDNQGDPYHQWRQRWQNSLECRSVDISFEKPANWLILRQILKEYLPGMDPVFMRSLSKDDWFVVQVTSTRDSDDPPFVFFKGGVSRKNIVWEWESVDPQIVEATREAIPGAPVALRRCFEITSGAVHGE